MKTAVEYFEFELKDKLGQIVINQNWKLLEDIIQQAKEMEKEQMKLSRVPIAYENKSWQGLMERHFEQWYNETFKSE